MKRLFILLFIFAISLQAQNLKLGERALDNITTGYDNTAIGINAGYRIITGYRNILLGFLTGNNLTTGSNNIFIGNKVSADSVNQSNSLNIGGVIKANLATGVVTIPKTGATTISGSITATDSTTSAILKDSAGIKWKLKVSPAGIVSADSTGLN